MLTNKCVCGAVYFVMIAGTVILGCSACPEGSLRAAPAADPQAAGTIEPCKLLTPIQVATVLPNNDGGTVTNSGGSFMKGVDAYQCSYGDRKTSLMTVILNAAKDKENFSWIKPSEGEHRDHRKIDVGDAGWVYGSPDDLKVEVVLGLTVIDLELMAPGAQGKSAAMIELARVIAQRLRK